MRKRAFFERNSRLLSFTLFRRARSRSDLLQGRSASNGSTSQRSRILRSFRERKREREGEREQCSRKGKIPENGKELPRDPISKIDRTECISVDKKNGLFSSRKV